MKVVYEYWLESSGGIRFSILEGGRRFGDTPARITRYAGHGDEKTFQQYFSVNVREEDNTRSCIAPWY
jgi:hypothetical protein